MTNLQTISESVKRLHESPHGERLQATKQLHTTLRDSISSLKELENELRPTTGRKAMNLLGLRALKWPFEKQDVERHVQDLNRGAQAVSLVLQVDQT